MTGSGPGLIENQIVAGAADERVVALIGNERVVARAADQAVGTRAGHEQVGARAGEHGLIRAVAVELDVGRGLRWRRPVVRAVDLRDHAARAASACSKPGFRHRRP